MVARVIRLVCAAGKAAHVIAFIERSPLHACRRALQASAFGNCVIHLGVGAACVKGSGQL